MDNVINLAVCTPNLLCNFLDELELVPLLFLCQVVADFARCESALCSQAEALEWDVLFCFMDTLNNSFLILEDW